MMSTNEPAIPENVDKRKEMEDLMILHYADLRSYIAIQVPYRSDADDIVQELCLTIWKKYDSFESGTNFKSWALQIAIHLIHNWRRRQKNNRILFSEEFFDSIHSEIVKDPDQKDEKTDRLKICLKKLREHQRNAIRLRYHLGFEIEQVADRIGRTVGATYRLLSRIRHALFECIHSQRHE